MVDVTKTTAWWHHRRALVSQCLTVRPRMTDEAKGWEMRAAEFDPDDRELCHAVGIAVHFDHPAIVLVWVLDPEDDPQRETAVFAHVDDLIQTNLPMSWPDVFPLHVEDRGERLVDVTHDAKAQPEQSEPDEDDGDE